jgi:oligopeptide/dipeptide ABC transporter ATP-binding protein
MSLVRLERVEKHFARRSGEGFIHAVNGVSFTIAPRETVALIGESGSGKSTVGRLILRLLVPSFGHIFFEGQDLAQMDHRSMRNLRSRLQVVFQEPFESLNPRLRTGAIVEEPLVIHRRDLSSGERRRIVAETLEMVGLGAGFADRFPGQLSGGQQQRVGIARAIVTNPSLIVLDEPTSSLDLSVRAQILDLLARLQRELDVAYLFISHDIHTVEYVSDRILVMYLGQVVESGPAEDLFREPKHPYTQALLSASLPVDPELRKERIRLQGEPPSPTQLPRGCFLYGRCPIGTEECTTAPVPLRPVGPDHEAACIKAPQPNGNGQVSRRAANPDVTPRLEG